MPWHDCFVSFIMKLRAVEFAALILSALVMGVFWGTWFTLTRSLDNFSAAEFIHIGKTIISNVAIPTEHPYAGNPIIDVVCNPGGATGKQGSRFTYTPCLSY